MTSRPRFTVRTDDAYALASQGRLAAIWLGLMGYCTRHNTGGVVPGDLRAHWLKPRDLQRMVEKGLCSLRSDGNLDLIYYDSDASENWSRSKERRLEKKSSAKPALSLESEPTRKEGSNESINESSKQPSGSSWDVQGFKKAFEAGHYERTGQKHVTKGWDVISLKELAAVKSREAMREALDEWFEAKNRGEYGLNRFLDYVKYPPPPPRPPSPPPPPPVSREEREKNMQMLREMLGPVVGFRKLNDDTPRA